MRIGFITTMSQLSWAGSEELWSGAAHKLLADGHEVDVFYSKSRGWAPQMESLKSKGATIVPYGFANASISKIISVFSARCQKLPVNDPLPRSNRWKQADLIVLSQGGCIDGQAWANLLLKSQRAFVILCQANAESQWPSDDEVERLCQYFAAARSVCFVSQDNERLFRSQTGYLGKNTKIVWNPVQPSTPRDPIAWPENESPLRFAMVARIEPYAKGHDLMLDVLSSPKWRNRDVSLTIYGKGPWEKTARKIVEQRNLRSVTFGGYAGPQDVWSSHHMLALPSRHEGMALAMIEAMWLGRPVIATAVAGAISEIQDGVNGILCPAASIDLWDSALEKAWSMRANLREMGSLAAQSIRGRLSHDPASSLAEHLLQQCHS